MRKIAILVVLLMMVGAGLSWADSTDPIVQRWVQQRDRKAVELVQQWASGVRTEDLVSLLAEIWALETYTLAMCRRESDWLAEHLIFVGKENGVSVETAPATILEFILEDDLLNPWRLFGSESPDKRR